MVKSYIKILVTLLLFFAFPAVPALAKTIEDMAGRMVEVPDKIERVYLMSQANMVYTLEPGLLCGLAYPLRDEERAMMDPRMRDLPVLGTLNGVGETANPEALLNARPDVVILTLMGPGDLGVATDRSEAVLNKIGIPYVYVTSRDINDYPAAYRFLGKLLGYEERAEELAAYIEAALADAQRVVAQIPQEQRPRVYYAEQLDGLSTEHAGSFHTSLLRLVGDVNVHRKQIKLAETKGYEKLTLEDVMAYQPDYILAFEKTFYEQVYANPGWKLVKAVQNKNVVWIPRGPHNWFDRPPSYMRALGLKWLLATLYPEYYQIDLESEARHFYKLFLFLDLTPEQAREIINPFG